MEQSRPAGSRGRGRGRYSRGPQGVSLRGSHSGNTVPMEDHRVDSSSSSGDRPLVRHHPFLRKQSPSDATTAHEASQGQKPIGRDSLNSFVNTPRNTPPDTSGRNGNSVMSSSVDAFWGQQQNPSLDSSDSSVNEQHHGHTSPLSIQSPRGTSNARAFKHNSRARGGSPQRVGSGRGNYVQSNQVDQNFSEERARHAIQGAARVPLSASHQSLLNSNNKHWALGQELKIMLSGVPKDIWTQDVHQALRKYGQIQYIEMQPTHSSAWVVFRPPPSDMRWLSGVVIKGVVTGAHIKTVQPQTVMSLVNAGKAYQMLNIIYGNSIDFGITTAPTTMVKMISRQAKGSIQMTLNLKRTSIEVQFPFSKAKTYRFELPIPQLHRIYKVKGNSSDQVSLIIPYNSPPQFYQVVKDPETLRKTFSPKDKNWHAHMAHYRETDVVEPKVRAQMASQPVMHLKDRPLIDIGRWTTYRLHFDASTLSGPQYEEFRGAIADHGIDIVEVDDFQVTEQQDVPIWKLIQEEISSTHPALETSGSESTFTDLVNGQIHLDYSVRYQLEVCMSNGLLKEHSITKEFLEKLASMDATPAVHLLEKVMDKQVVRYDPMSIFNMRIKRQRAKNIPSYCILARSVTITPTMLHVASPSVETSNRIIRKFIAAGDRFIRVRFSDEKTEGRLGYQGEKSEAPFARISRAMKHGIVVAGRYFEFLAFGNSQFRENGAYFYAPTPSKSADDIRRSLGEFHHIRTVAKFGARIGQCFSTTRAVTTPLRLERIPDIENNGYTFSDGVGKISKFLAMMAAKELGLQNAFEDPPSLYQFRLGGLKGVLALDPALQGNIIQYRPSQYKFEAPLQGLEVIRASALATAFFNRQLIVVLSTLGVDDWMFIRKQQDMVNYLELATTEEAVALQKLQQNVDCNQITLTMAAMILDGFMSSKDPFMMSMLQLWRAHNIKYLKEKARILIEDGAFVLGCVDETATLRGHCKLSQDRETVNRDEKLADLPEIFLQISNPQQKGYRIIEGTCILARNPSLHPGDIRIVRAVDVPALHHLKNVVVLPSKGDRDVANMCSGGDLDGDDYLVLWDSNFLPRDINDPAMDFTAEKPVDLDRPVTVADMADFFVTYMKNDTLGRIAHAHLAQADFNSEGVRDSKCLELAALHSQAVDFNKSGIPARLERDLLPMKWPHFMEKKHVPETRIYKSKKVLGMLYDQVELVDFKPQYKNPFDNRILNAFASELTESMLGEAETIKTAYDDSLRRLMAKHAVRTEFEIWSIFVLSHNQESRDYKFAEELGRTVEGIKHQFRDTCIEAAGATNTLDFAKLGPFLAAMYTVTAREMAAALQECNKTTTIGGRSEPVRSMTPEEMPFMSFPWLFPYELGRVATGTGIHREPAGARPGVPKHHKANRETSMLETEQIVVETQEGGVTHFGEVLKLGEEHEQAVSETINTFTSGISNRPNHNGTGNMKSISTQEKGTDKVVGSENSEINIYQGSNKETGAIRSHSEDVEAKNQPTKKGKHDTTMVFDEADSKYQGTKRGKHSTASMAVEPGNDRNTHSLVASEGKDSTDGGYDRKANSFIERLGTNNDEKKYEEDEEDFAEEFREVVIRPKPANASALSRLERFKD